MPQGIPGACPIVAYEGGAMLHCMATLRGVSAPVRWLVAKASAPQGEGPTLGLARPSLEHAAMLKVMAPLAK